MAEAWLNVDLAGIQNYVFGSRRLIDTIGRAAQIEDLTDERHLRSAGVLGPGEKVIRRGAGTLTLSASDEAAARALAARYSRLVTTTSDALRPVLAVQPGVAGREEQELRTAADVMRRARHDRAPELPPCSPLGVVRCAVTGSPAEEVRDGTPVVREIGAARERGRTWHRAWQAELLDGAPLPEGGHRWALPTLVDQLGRSEDQHSQVAVLVADVNGLGDTLAMLAHEAPEYLPDAARLLREVGHRLARALVHRVAAAVEASDDGMRVSGFPAELRFPLHRAQSGEDAGAYLLPVRPWVIAGDDLVLLCDGRLAWSLADEAMRWLDASSDDALVRLRALPGFADTAERRALTLGIGMAVVPVGYSLRHAHELAQHLCRHAKQVRRDRGWHGHVIDWHRGAAPPAAVVGGRRTRGSLPCARPLVYDRPDGLQAEPRTVGWRAFLDECLSPHHEGSLRRTDGDVPAGWAAHGTWVRGELPHHLRAGPTRTADMLQRRRTRQERLDGTTLPALLTQGEQDGLVNPRWGNYPPRYADALDLSSAHLELGRRDGATS